MSTLTVYGYVIAPSVIALLAVLGATLKYGKLKTNVNDLKDFVFPKGEPKLVTKVVYDQAQQTITEKLDTIDRRICGMDDRRERAREDNASELRQIAHFMGKVDQYMQDHDET